MPGTVSLQRREPSPNMQRQPNAVDFWRGFALITIFIDHIPGLVYAKYTLINFSSRMPPISHAPVLVKA
jgi:hypothetical protein